MVKVEFLGPINKEPASFNVASLAELKEILSRDESLQKWLDICAVALNDEIVSDLNTTLKDGDKICILPPVCGG